MTLSKVVRKGSYQGVAQWGINTSSEITPSRKTAQKWAELENAQTHKCRRCSKPTEFNFCSDECRKANNAAMANGNYTSPEALEDEAIRKLERIERMRETIVQDWQG